MTFRDGHEMLTKIQEGWDFYNPKTEEYVFCYSESGSICVYHVDNESAANLKETAGEYWGAYLGAGGTIYDDPLSEFYTKGDYTNLDWCNDYYQGEWEDVTGMNIDFVNDEEKMVDYWDLTKEQFLSSYSYLTEEEYEATREIIGDRDNILAKLRYLIKKAGIYNDEICVWQDDDSTVGIDVGGKIWSNFLDPETAECEVRCLIKGYQLGKTIA